MISKKMLSLLTAVAVSGGTATVAVAAPTVIASEQTMAEQYQPHYDEEPFRAVPRHFFPVRTDEPLPPGTTFSLVDSGDNDYISHGAVMIAMRSDNGTLHVWFNSLSTPTPGVTTVPVRVAAHYPDGSSEIFVSNVSVTPEDAHAYDIHYPGIEVEAGTTASANPSTNHQGYPVPAETTFAITGYQEVHDRRAEGWVIDVDSDSGELTVAAPEGADDPVSIPVSVTYPDGSWETTWAEARAVEPITMAEIYDVSYGGMAVFGGESLTVTPQQVGLPASIEISLGDNTELVANGWGLDVTSEGELTATAPVEADGTFPIALVVTYPDGSSETTTAEIIVTPSPNDQDDKEAGNPRTETPKPSDPERPSRPQFGSSSFGSS